jgi:hypothetical protein
MTSCQAFLRICFAALGSELPSVEVSTGAEKSTEGEAKGAFPQSAADAPVCVGVGTAILASLARQAVDAGAHFCVSPGLVPAARVELEGHARRVDRVIDTTAAGDAFAGGYLAARLAGHAPALAAGLGNGVAAVVIQHSGAITPPGIRLSPPAGPGTI